MEHVTFKYIYHFSHCYILSRLYIFVVLGVMYLVNSNLVHIVFSCCVLFLCITSLLLDIGLVLVYLLFPMSGHNKVIM